MTLHRIEAQWTLGGAVFTRTSLLKTGLFRRWYINERRVPHSFFLTKFKGGIDGIDPAR